MTSNIILGEHHYYLDGSSYVCKFCFAGFSVYDVTKNILDYMTKLDCLSNSDKFIKNDLFNNHEFELKENTRSFYCKYCLCYLFSSFDSDCIPAFPQCISNEEKIIKDIIE